MVEFSLRSRRNTPHQPFQRIHSPNAVVIERRIIIKRQKNLRMIVRDCLKRPQFPIERRFIAYSGRNLEIANCIVVARHKINLKVFVLAYTDIEASTQQFKVDDIFKKVPDIRSCTAQNNAAQRQINSLVLLQSNQQPFSLYVKAFCLIKKLTSDKCRQILVNCFCISTASRGTKRIGNFSSRQFTAYTVE